MSQMDFNEFRNVEDAEDFSLVNHNPRDYANFEQSLHRIDDAFEKLEKEQAIERKKAVVKQRLQAWDDGLHGVWKLAKLDKLDNKAAAEKAIAFLDEKLWGSFFIHGDPGSGKTFLALAIIRRLIARGKLAGNHVYQTSEEALLGALKAGFKGVEVLEEPYQKDYRVFLVENVGGRAAYDEKEQAVWERLFDHGYRNDAIFIFTTHGSWEGFKHKLSEVAAARVERIIEGRVIGLNRPDDYVTEKEQKEEEQENHRASGRAAFSQRRTPKKS